MKNVLITGGGGFVGQRLAGALLAQTPAPDKIVCLDQGAGALNDPRISYVTGDVSDRSVINACIDAQTDTVFHLAAVVSGTAEADFDLGMRVNLGGTRHVLDRCRELGHQPTVVFSSSIAAFGGDMPAVIDDMTPAMPQGSYGIQKVAGELLVQDYSRKGFINGCSLRLPTVVVRPGKPNGAASSFASAIIREPLAGEPMVLPVDPTTEMWSASPGVVVKNLIHAAGLPGEAWSSWRVLNLPGRVVPMTDAIEALRRVAGDEVAGLIRHEPDDAINRLVSTWAARLDTPRALSMGFVVDEDFDQMLTAYINENPDAIKVPVKRNA